MTSVARPPSGGYLASETDLGFKFTYPPEYLESISWQESDLAADREGLNLSFLQVNEIIQWLPTARKASKKRLVPFARGDNGDWLCCFDASDSSKVYVINLGDKTPSAHEWSATGYLGFLDAYLPNNDIAIWRPSQNKS